MNTTMRQAWSPENRQTQKYFTKKLAQEAAASGQAWGYKYRLNPEVIQRQPENAEFPVEIAQEHYRRNGKPAENYIRAKVLIENNPDVTALVDVSIEFWNGLPYSPLKLGGTVWA